MTQLERMYKVQKALNACLFKRQEPIFFSVFYSPHSIDEFSEDFTEFYTLRRVRKCGWCQNEMFHGRDCTCLFDHVEACIEKMSGKHCLETLMWLYGVYR